MVSPQTIGVDAPSPGNHALPPDVLRFAPLDGRVRADGLSGRERTAPRRPHVAARRRLGVDGDTERCSDDDGNQRAARPHRQDGQHQWRPAAPGDDGEVAAGAGDSRLSSSALTIVDGPWNSALNSSL